MKEIAKYKGFDSSSETRGWISYFICTIEFLRCSTQHGTISVNAATRYESNSTLYVDQSVKVITVIENDKEGDVYDNMYSMKVFSQLHRDYRSETAEAGKH